MKTNITEFLCDAKGEFSMMRALVGLTVLAPLTILFIQLFQHKPLDWYEAIAMLSTGLLGKIGQKHYEKNEAVS